MARSFLSFSFALATATAVLLGPAVLPASAQPATPATPSPAAKQKQYPEVQEALKALVQERNLQKALKILEELSRKNPELPSSYVLMYQIMAQMNQAGAARFQLELGVKNTPSDPEPWVILGTIALSERRIAEATLDFDKAKKLLESYANAERKNVMEQQTLSGIAQLAEANESWKDAEARLTSLLALAPKDLVAYQRLARSQFWQGKAKEAYDTLKKAKQIDVDTAKNDKTPERFLTPEAIMAQYYQQFEGDTKDENPKKWFEAALRKAPDDLTTRQVIAIWALERGDVAFAKIQADNALRIEKEKGPAASFVGRMLRGLVALWEKKWDEAENYFQQVILEVPNDFVARNNLALALVEQKDTAKKQRALAYAQENYQSNNKSPDALSTLGWVYFRRGEFDQARLALSEAVKATGGNINNPDTATYLAYILYHQDQKWQAKDLLDNVFKMKRPFSMMPEAKELYEKVKDEKKPADATPPAAVGPK